MTTFYNFDLSKELPILLDDMGFKTPTPIQEQTIPIALEGKDVIGSAQTGTGKTAAFVLPMLSKLLTNKEGSALILTPTRELALQISAFVTKLLGRNSHLRSALMIGGEPIFKQFKQLRNRPRIYIGTPGRVYDHLCRGTLDLGDTNFLVLDEMDRMLDIGFGVQLEAIAEYLPTERQTLMFSATLPKSIERLSQKYLTNPVRISVGATEAVALNLKQETVHTTQVEKYPQLLKELDERAGSIIIFVKTKVSAEILAQKLEGKEHSADYIHGDLKQNRRARAVAEFARGKFRILVATDVAARGLDIKNLDHVINYDLPQCPEDYIHRIGRTARAGAEGCALSFITPDARRMWQDIQNMLNPGQKQSSEREHSPRSGQRSGRSGGGRNSFFGKNRSGDDRSNRFGKPGGFGGRKSRDDSAERGGERRSFDRKPREGSTERGGERKPFDRDRPQGDARSERFGKPGGFDRKPREGSAERGGERKSFDRVRDRSDDRSNRFGKPGGFDRKPREGSAERGGERKPFSRGRDQGDTRSASGKPDRLGKVSIFDRKPRGDFAEKGGERKSFGRKPDTKKFGKPSKESNGRKEWKGRS